MAIDEGNARSPSYHDRWSRRELLTTIAAGGIIATSGLSFFHWMKEPPLKAETFIGNIADYSSNIRNLIEAGLKELGITHKSIKGKRILLKPNLVESAHGTSHINTHPLVIRATVESFLSLGAAEVAVGEGPGHRRDTLDVIDTAGLTTVLHEDQISFLNLNYEDGRIVRNLGRTTDLTTLTFPRILDSFDWIVSLAKMKTHHWAGATLSMKNLFGVMPGIYYGWPKNVLHHAGITNSIIDINATLKPHFAIVDGIVGMEGDGPIMGTPIQAKVVVMGKNLPAVDATCCRLMSIDPYQIDYLAKVENWLGPIDKEHIRQVGESIQRNRQTFKLLDHIPAHQGIRSMESA